MRVLHAWPFACAAAQRRALIALLGAVCLIPLVAGCGSQAALHPALQLGPEQVEKAEERAKGLIQTGADPSHIFSRLTRDANVRVSGSVVLRKAAACWPQQELTFEIAQQGDDSNAGMERAAGQALKRLRREIKFVAFVEMPIGRDPATITFAMRTSRDTVEYPPTAVSPPVHLRDLRSALDPDAPPAALWSYEIWFPIAGGPGYPPIDESVASLCLVVRDSESAAECWFDLPIATSSGNIGF